LIEAANFARIAFHNGIAKAYLTITTDHHLAIAAH